MSQTTKWVRDSSPSIMVTVVHCGRHCSRMTRSQIAFCRTASSTTLVMRRRFCSCVRQSLDRTRPSSTRTPARFWSASITTTMPMVVTIALVILIIRGLPRWCPSTNDSTTARPNKASISSCHTTVRNRTTRAVPLRIQSILLLLLLRWFVWCRIPPRPVRTWRTTTARFFSGPSSHHPLSVASASTLLLLALLDLSVLARPFAPPPLPPPPLS
mmetsp:Transcript_13663/g.24107  ORF Transcript_13663/g.24107 Transcript_13663/m.24107 type:complete len:214 (+) Transcript_13663:1686-2327(+)